MGVVLSHDFEQARSPKWKQQVRDDVRRYKARWRVSVRALHRLWRAFLSWVRRISLHRAKPVAGLQTGYDGSTRRLTTNSKMKLILASDPIAPPRLTAPVEIDDATFARVKR